MPSSTVPSTIASGEPSSCAPPGSLRSAPPCGDQPVAAEEDHAAGEDAEQRRPLVGAFVHRLLDEVERDRTDQDAGAKAHDQPDHLPVDADGSAATAPMTSEDAARSPSRTPRPSAGHFLSDECDEAVGQDFVAERSATRASTPCSARSAGPPRSVHEDVVVALVVAPPSPVFCSDEGGDLADEDVGLGKAEARDDRPVVGDAARVGLVAP